MPNRRFRSSPFEEWAQSLSENIHLLQANVEEHGQILDAIAAHDPRAARKAMTRHVSRSGELVTRGFEQLQSRAGA